MGFSVQGPGMTFPVRKPVSLRGALSLDPEMDL